MPETTVATGGETSIRADYSAGKDTQAQGGLTMHKCPACSSLDTVQLFHAKDHLVSRREFLVRRCKSCGMGWTADPPPENDAGSYYVSEEYISHTDRRQSVSDYLYHLARRLMLVRKHNLVTRATGKNTGILLDIGSGTGYFAAFMKKRNWEVTATEINDEARTYSIEKSGINAMAPGEVKNIPSGYADCVTFWHVLEHLYDPVSWLGEAKRVLSPEGKCIIALPNFSSADAFWFGNNWAALDVPRHLWHFTPEALNLFVSKQGFTVEKITALPLDIYYISALSYRNHGVPLPLIRGLITGAFLSIRSGFRKEKASSLVFVLSRKK